MRATGPERCETLPTWQTSRRLLQKSPPESRPWPPRHLPTKNARTGEAALSSFPVPGAFVYPPNGGFSTRWPHTHTHTHTHCKDRAVWLLWRALMRVSVYPCFARLCQRSMTGEPNMGYSAIYVQVNPIACKVILADEPVLCAACLSSPAQGRITRRLCAHSRRHASSRF